MTEGEHYDQQPIEKPYDYVLGKLNQLLGFLQRIKAGETVMVPSNGQDVPFTHTTMYHRYVAAKRELKLLRSGGSPDPAAHIMAMQILGEVEKLGVEIFGRMNPPKKPK